MGKSTQKGTGAHLSPLSCVRGCIGWGENISAVYLELLRCTRELSQFTSHLDTQRHPAKPLHFNLFALEMVFSKGNSYQRYSFRKIHSKSSKRKSVKVFENCASWLDHTITLWLEHSPIFNFPLNCFNSFACHLILIFKFLAFLHLFFP